VILKGEAIYTLCEATFVELNNFNVYKICTFKVDII